MSTDHDSAYCTHCRDERAAGLESYDTWRATAPAHLFEDDLPLRTETAARRPHVYVYAERNLEALTLDHAGRLAAPVTGRWVWSVYDAQARRLDHGLAPTWPAALELGSSTLVLHLVRELLAEAAAGDPW